MKKMRAVLCLVLLSACSSAEERLCKSDLNQTLMNPETASFSDFRMVTQEQIRADEYLTELQGYVSEIIPKEGASYYKMKVRAEGTLGNKITSTQFCAVSAGKGKCTCLTAS